MLLNEHDPYAAQWLRNLWPDATVDERSVVDLDAADLADHQRVHLFAGIGGWEYALRLAGWPNDSPVWTGSCPCQPFSSAGRAGGVLDERHLWPAFHRLIAECRPPVIFGEQVTSRAGRAWLAGVRADLEGLGYAVGAADLCAASVGAPHIRQRLFWVADAGYTERGKGNRSCDSGREQLLRREREKSSTEPGECGEVFRLGHPIGPRLEERTSEPGDDGAKCVAVVGAGGDAVGVAHSEGATPGTSDDVRARESNSRDSGGLGHAGGDGCGEREHAGAMVRAAGQESEYEQRIGTNGPFGARPDGGVGDAKLIGCDREPRGRAGDEPPITNPWADAIWFPCLDGKARRTQSGIRVLVDGLPFVLADGRTREGVSRSGTLRALGNAIVPHIAAAFVRAYMEARGLPPAAAS